MNTIVIYERIGHHKVNRSLIHCVCYETAAAFLVDTSLHVISSQSFFKFNRYIVTIRLKSCIDSPLLLPPAALLQLHLTELLCQNVKRFVA